MFIKSILVIAYIYLFGYKVYSLIYKIKKFDKISLRAQIGYLYDYDFTNIFRIWLFIQAKVIRIRDVKFDDIKLYYLFNLELSALRDAEIKRVVESLEIPDIINELLYRVEGDSESEYDSDIIVVNVPNRFINFRSTQNKSLESTQLEKQPLSTPIQLPSPVSSSPETILTLSRQITPHIESQATENASESTLQAENSAESAYSSIPDEPFINTNSRNARVYARSAVSIDSDVANILFKGLKRIKRFLRKQIQATILYDPNLIIYYYVFIASIRIFVSTKRRTHISKLFKKFRTWKDLLNHPRKLEFIVGYGKKITDLTKINIFNIINILEYVISRDLLPLIQVFKYKTDSDGFIIKYKSKLVIKNNL